MHCVIFNKHSLDFTRYILSKRFHAACKNCRTSHKVCLYSYVTQLLSVCTVRSNILMSQDLVLTLFPKVGRRMLFVKMHNHVQHSDVSYSRHTHSHVQHSDVTQFFSARTGMSKTLMSHTFCQHAQPCPRHWRHISAIKMHSHITRIDMFNILTSRNCFSTEIVSCNITSSNFFLTISKAMSNTLTSRTLLSTQ